MTNQSHAQAIEMEVLEIDGAAPVMARAEPAFEGDARQQSWQDWQNWQGRVRRLDRRWWPLWLLLGAVLIALLLTFGLAATLIYLVIRTIRSVIRGLVSAFVPSSQNLVR